MSNVQYEVSKEMTERLNKKTETKQFEDNFKNYLDSAGNIGINDTFILGKISIFNAGADRRAKIVLVAKDDIVLPTTSLFLKEKAEDGTETEVGDPLEIPGRTIKAGTPFVHTPVISGLVPDKSRVARDRVTKNIFDKLLADIVYSVNPGMKGREVSEVQPEVDAIFEGKYTGKAVNIRITGYVYENKNKIEGYDTVTRRGVTKKEPIYARGAGTRIYVDGPKQQLSQKEGIAILKEAGASYPKEAGAPAKETATKTKAKPDAKVRTEVPVDEASEVEEMAF